MTDANIDPATVPDDASKLTSAQIDALNPAQAGAMIAALQAKHAARVVAEAAEAAAKVAAANPVKEEPLRPTDADGNAIPLPDAGIVSSIEMNARRYAEYKADYEALGFPPTDIDDYVEGRKLVSVELQKHCETKLAAFGRDAEWRKRFYAGDADARFQWELATKMVAAAKIQRYQG